MKRPVPVQSAPALIDEKIKELGDWCGKTLVVVAAAASVCQRRKNRMLAKRKE
jgi:hypothetical protein